MEKEYILKMEVRIDNELSKLEDRIAKLADIVKEFMKASIEGFDKVKVELKL